MTRFEAILKEVDGLSDSERAQLLEILVNGKSPDAEADEIAVGLRGLASWTESTRDESWSQFYPEALTGGGA